MKKWKLYSSVLMCVALTGCASKGDLDDLKMRIDKDNAVMEQRINDKLEKNLAEMSEQLSVLHGKMDKINEQMALSRNIESVQITFNTMKKKIEDAESKIKSYNARIEDLKSDLSKSSTSNRSIQQEISEIEGKMDELIQLLESQVQ